VSFVRGAKILDVGYIKSLKFKWRREGADMKKVHLDKLIIALPEVFAYPSPM